MSRDPDSDPHAMAETAPDTGERVSHGETLPAGGQAPGDLADLRTIDAAEYELGRELARGGMGRVRHARDRRHGRPVAIKELLVDTAAARARFRREALITARLQHPAIVPVYEAGTWPTGEPFYAMKLVEGVALDRAIAKRATLRERLGLLPNVIAVAEALAYAHGRRVIHRDLKPANILVGAFGETVVIDWGLAKDLDAGASDEIAADARSGSADGALTSAGDAIGTPAYMPPEQARGEAVTEAADVYALGAMLYHLLAGKMPYADSGNAKELLARLLDGPPRPLPAEVPPDLLAIVTKAMAREPGDRYPSAKELAEDLSRFETGQLVGAHDYTFGALVARWLRRHRALVAVTAAAIVVLAIVAVISFRRVAAERDLAERRGHEIELARQEATDRVEELSLDRARGLLESDPAESLALARSVAPGSRWQRVAQLIATVAEAWGSSIEVWRGAPLYTLAVSDDGRTLAWPAGDELWVQRSGGAPEAIAMPSSVGAVAVSADGTRIAASSNTDHRVYLIAGQAAPAPLDEAFGALIYGLRFDGDLLVAIGERDTGWWDLRDSSTMLIRPDPAEVPRPAPADLLVVTRRGGALELYDRRTRHRVAAPDTYRNSWTLQSAARSADGTQLLYVDPSRAVEELDLASGTTRRIGISGTSTVLVWVGRVGDFRVTVDIVGAIQVWAGDGIMTAAYAAAGGGVGAAAAVGERLALGLEDGVVVVVDPARGVERRFRGHVGEIGNVQRVRDGDTDGVVSAGLDGVIRRWRFSSTIAPERWLHTSPVESVAISRAGAVASMTGSGGVFLWDPDAGDLRALDRDVRGLRIEFSPDDRYLVWGGGGGNDQVRFVDLTAGTTSPSELQGCDDRPEFASASPRFACVRRADAAVVVWDTNTWQPVAISDGAEQVDSFALAPDGQSIAVGRYDAKLEVMLWDLANDRRSSWIVHGNVWDVEPVAGRPWFVTGDGNRKVMAWRAPDEVAVVAELAGTVTQIATSRTLVASGADDGTLGLWDLERLRSRQLRTESGASAAIRWVSLDPDGTTAVTLDVEGAAVVWDVATGKSVPLPGVFRSALISGDGRFVAAGRVDGRVLRLSLPAHDVMAAPDRTGWSELTLDWKPAVAAPAFVEDRDSAWSQLRTGKRLLAGGRLEEARSRFERAIELGDLDGRWALVGVDVAEAAPADRAALALARAEELARAYPWELQVALQYVITSEDAPAARKVAILRAWRDAAGDDRARVNQLTYLALRAGALDLALELAERLLPSEDPGTLDTVAEVFHMRGDTARALELEGRAVSGAPNNTTLLENLARFRRGEREPAAEVLRITAPSIGPPAEPARVVLPSR